MADFWPFDTRLFSNKKLNMLNADQMRIWLYSMFGSESRSSGGTGIYPIGTGKFFTVDSEIVVEQLGRTKEEVSLLLYNSMNHELATSDLKYTRGKMTSDFPDIIEYDPEKDMVNCKLLFEFAASKYLTTDTAIVESIHKDFKARRHDTPERWWAEFAYRNRSRIHEAWEGFKEKNTAARLDEKSKGHKNYKALEKTFTKLFELEKKYSPSNIPANSVCIKKMEKFVQNFEVEKSY